MKNFYKIGALALALVAILFVTLQAEAQNGVSLEITGGSITCSHSGFVMGSTGSSLSAQTLGATAASAVYTCTDLQGTTSDSLDVTMGTSITNSTTTIPDSSVTITAGSVTDNCAGTVTPANGTLDGSIALMTKDTASDVCTFSNTPSLTVVVPAAATVGTYAGVLTVTYPS